MRDVYEWRTLDEAARDGYDDAEYDFRRELEVSRGYIEGLERGLQQTERMYMEMLKALTPPMANFPPPFIVAVKEPKA